jgi:hypothetical protein
MAAKVKMLKLLQEINGFAHIANRNPSPRSPGLFLAQFRSQGTHETLRRRRLSIMIDEPTHPDIPYQVKIHHVKQNPDSAAMLPAP